MTARDLLLLAMENLQFAAPALLLFVGLMFADSMVEFVVRMVRQAGKQFRL